MDISSNEQSTFCMHFVDLEKCLVREEFIRFVVTHDLSGEGLCKFILNEL